MEPGAVDLAYAKRETSAALVHARNAIHALTRLLAVGGHTEAERIRYRKARKKLYKVEKALDMLGEAG